MATTFNAEYYKALGERGLALSNIRSAIRMKKDADIRKEDLELILFGDGVNYGVVSILSIMYTQVWYTTGKVANAPVLHDFEQAKNQYRENFALSVTPAGDGIRGLHPPQVDNPDAGQDNVDPNSIWLTDHGLETSMYGTGIIQLLENLADVVGVVASANGDGRGPYLTEEDAQVQMLVDGGYGILGLRTENSEIFLSGVDQWTIGQNGIDTPDNFTKKSSLISALKTIQDRFNSLLGVLQQEVDLLEGTNGDILKEFRVDLPDDPGLNDFINQVNEFIVKVQDYIDYFNQFDDPSPVINRADINSKLSEVLVYSQTIATAMNNRTNSIVSGMLGNASEGTRKHLVFWITEVVTKPDGPYAMLLAASDLLTMAQTNLSNRNSRLNFFTSNHDEWIETPLIQSIYDQAIMNVDKETINRWESNVLWNLVMSANKYMVLYKKLSEMLLPLNNDLWDESLGIWITDILPTTFLRNILTMSPPQETVIFRLVAFDTAQGESGDLDRADTFDTKSPQSDIISNDISFVQLENTANNQNVIMVNISEGLKERDFLMINDSEIAQIMAVTDDNYALDTDYGIINKIQKLFGVYFKLLE